VSTVVAILKVQQQQVRPRERISPCSKKKKMQYPTACTFMKSPLAFVEFDLSKKVIDAVRVTKML
jgi:hypothetical protein